MYKDIISLYISPFLLQALADSSEFWKYLIEYKEEEKESNNS